jgi:hypothetical protein
LKQPAGAQASDACPKNRNLGHETILPPIMDSIAA